MNLKDLVMQSGADFDGDVVKYCGNDILITKELLRKQFMEEKEMEMIRKITLIGSMRNKEAMLEIYNKLTLRGDIVYLPYMGVIPEDTDDCIITRLHDLHQDKMRRADFIIVVDKNNYIGKDTQNEIKWCESQAMRIIYASDLAMLDTSQPAKSKK